MKILVVGPSWVGDMCMAQVLFKLIKQQYPAAIIDVLAPQWTSALLDRMPEVNTSISLPFGHGEFQFRKRKDFGIGLRASNYDWSFVLPNSWKSAVIPWAAKIPKRTGWVGELRYGLLNDTKKLVKKDFPLMIQRFAAMMNFNITAVDKNKLPIPQLVANVENQKRLIQELGLELNKPVLALCPGAEFGVSKIWPADKVSEVARFYLKQEWQVWLLGSPNDEYIAQEIVSKIDVNLINLKNLVGKTKLADAVDLLALADLTVANDSGLMHIASALNKKVVAIYGSTSPEFTPPLGHDTHVVRVMDLYCSPCFQRTCKEGHLKCLKDISSQQVIDVLNI